MISGTFMMTCRKKKRNML